MQIEVSVPAFRIEIPDEALNVLDGQKAIDDFVKGLVRGSILERAPTVKVCEPHDRAIPPLTTGDPVEATDGCLRGKRGTILAISHIARNAKVDFKEGSTGYATYRTVSLGCLKRIG